MFALQSGFLDKSVPDRVVDLGFILYIVSSMLFQTMVKFNHAVLSRLANTSRVWWDHAKVRDHNIHSV